MVNRRHGTVAFLAVVGLPSQIAWGHPTGREYRGQWWLAWEWDELVMVNLSVLTLAYVVGWRNGNFRYASGLAFLLGIAAIAVALLSPLDVLGESLGWVHMLQHMLLMTIAAPLVVCGEPARVMLWSLPNRLRSARLVGRLWRSVWGTRSRRLWCNPWFALGLHTFVMWGWHFPPLCEAALQDPLVHDLEHVSMFAAAVVFWQAIVFPAGQLHPGPRQLRAGPSGAQPAISAGLLFVTSVAGMVLGALMALSPSVWYPSYVGRTAYWGWTPLEDQQLAGSLMWMPACAAYPLVAIIILFRWLVALDARSHFA